MPPSPPHHRCHVLRLIPLALVMTAAAAAPAFADDTWRRDDDGSLTLQRALVLPAVGAYGRQPIQLDPIAAAVAERSFTPPAEGVRVTAVRDGEARAWQWHEAEDGALAGDQLVNAYVHVSVEVDQPTMMLLDAAGHAVVYVNDIPLAGDTYHTQDLLTPIRLEAGANHLLFQVARDRLTVRLRPVADDVMFSGRDDTLFDALSDRPIHGAMGIVVINATERWQSDLSVRVEGDGLTGRTTPLPPIPPMTLRKMPVAAQGPTPASVGPLTGRLTLLDADGEVRDTRDLTLDVRPPHSPHRRTFISMIDDSVQYYAVQPATAAAAADPVGPPADPAGDAGERLTPGQLRVPTDDPASPRLVLALHGAGIEAIDHVSAYAPKPWAHIVAPTNRRPFGFDWEDWGRLDAIEVLDLAAADLQTDRDRTYLTGHSMGGHGAWHLGVTYPDRFAAIAPSAGWISVFRYGVARGLDEADDPVSALMRRTMNASDTIALKHNLAPLGVYVLHGSDDATVPVAQARTMRSHLGQFHRDFAYHEKPGAGHWWDGERSAGTDTVDWPPIFEMFAARSLPQREAVRRIAFATAHPGVSARKRWAVVHTQIEPFVISRIDLAAEETSSPDDNGVGPASALRGATENVAILQLDADRFRSPLAVELDGEEFRVEFEDGRSRLYLGRDADGRWEAIDAPPRRHKHPRRAGPFKAAFANRMIFVYATQGDDAENDWAYAKARLDAQTFYYRGNGDVQLVRDVDYEPADYPERSVIVYGHAESNAAWPALLADSPVQVTPGRVALGERDLEGDDLAAVFVRPHPHSDTAHVAAVTGTSAEGMRQTDRLPWFVSAVAYPDFFIFRSRALRDGLDAVEAAGFFAPDWSLDADTPDF